MESFPSDIGAGIKTPSNRGINYTTTILSLSDEFTHEIVTGISREKHSGT
jgi:hypothetical protein